MVGVPSRASDEHANQGLLPLQLGKVAQGQEEWEAWNSLRKETSVLLAAVSFQYHKHKTYNKVEPLRYRGAIPDARIMGE